MQQKKKKTALLLKFEFVDHQRSQVRFLAFRLRMHSRQCMNKNQNVLEKMIENTGEKPIGNKIFVSFVLSS